MKQYTPSKSSEQILERLISALDHYDRSSKSNVLDVNIVSAEPLSKQTDRLQRTLLSDLRKSALSSDHSNNTSIHKQSAKTLVDTVKISSARVSIVNAGRDIVDPITDHMRKNMLDHHVFLSKTQSENAAYMNRIIGSIGALNKDTKASDRGILLTLRQFARNPVWMSLNFIGKALKGIVTTTASLLWSLAFGKKDEKLTIDEKILQAIKEQTEFFMKGNIDKTKGFWDRMISGGLIGGSLSALGRGALSGLGISQSAAQKREIERSQGKTSLSRGMWGGLSDWMYGSEIKKYGRQGGILGNKTQPESCDKKDCRRKSKPEYTYDVNLVELPNIIREVFDDSGELIKKQIHNQEQFSNIFEGVFEVIEHIDRETAETVHELKKQNRRSFMGLLMQGITGIATAVGSIAGAVFSAAGIISGALKDAGLKALLSAKDVLGSIFKKGGIGPCIPTCGGIGDIGGKEGKPKDDAPKPKDKTSKPNDDTSKPKKGALGTVMRLGGVALTGASAAFYLGNAGEGSDLGLGNLPKTKEQQEYEKLVHEKSSWFGGAIDVLGTKESKLKAAADESNERARREFNSNLPALNTPSKSQTSTIVDELKTLTGEGQVQTRFQEQMLDALEQLKQITLDPEGYKEKFKSITGFGVNPSSGVNFGGPQSTVDQKNNSTRDSLRQRLFSVPPSSFGKESELPESLESPTATPIPDQSTNMRVAPSSGVNFGGSAPNGSFSQKLFSVPPSSFGKESELPAVTPIPDQSTNMRVVPYNPAPMAAAPTAPSDSRMVQLLASIDSKLNNINQSNSEAPIGFGNDANTILNIYGGVA